MRHRPRVDANQGEICKALEDCGVSVMSLAGVGNGCPDLLISVRGELMLVEVKSDKGRLTPDQERWRARWGGPVYIVRSVEQALRLLRMPVTPRSAGREG